MLDLAYYRTASGRSPVEDHLDSFDLETQAYIDEALDTFCDEFPEVESVSVRPLRGKLWEIRVKDHRGRNHRLLYVVVGKTLLILHAFVKTTAKTPKKELKLALQRLGRVLRSGGH